MCNLLITCCHSLASLEAWPTASFIAVCCWTVGLTVFELVVRTFFSHMPRRLSSGADASVPLQKFSFHHKSGYCGCRYAFGWCNLGNLSSDMSMGTPCNVILVLQVPKYSVCNLTDFVVRILLVRFLSLSSVAGRISNMAFDLMASTFGVILRPLSTFSIISQLMLISIWDLTSEFSREIVRVATTSRTDSIDSSSFPTINSLYFSYRALSYSGTFFALSIVHTVGVANRDLSGLWGDSSIMLEWKAPMPNHVHKKAQKQCR